MALLVTLLLSSLTILAVVHWMAIHFFLYWKYSWLDMPIHLLGGICVAFGLATLPYLRVSLPQFFATYGGYIVTILVVGTVWEVFEFATGISKFDADFIPDTLIDYIMDIVGMSLGYGIVKSLKSLV